MLLSRSAWLARSAAVAAAAAWPRVAGAQALIPLKVGVGLIEPQAEAYYARAQGLFRQNGLDATLTISANGSATSAAVAGGALDVGITSVLGLAQAVERGLPFVAFASGGVADARFPASGVFVLPDAKVTGFKDLAGKTVAVATAKGLDQLLVSVLMEKAGGDPGTLKWIEMRPPEMYAALQAGRVDAINVENPEYSVVKPKAKLLGDGETAIAPFFVETAWFSTRSWLEKNTDAARRFRTAVSAAGAWAMDHPEAAAAVLRADLKVETQRAAQRFATKVVARDYQVLLDAAARFKFIGAINANDFVKIV